MGWRSDLPYVGPHQRASERVAAETAAGEYSFIDALVSAGIDAGEAVGFGKESDPLGHAYREMSDRIAATLRSTGIHYRTGCRESSTSVAAVGASPPS